MRRPRAPSSRRTAGAAHKDPGSAVYADRARRCGGDTRPGNFRPARWLGGVPRGLLHGHPHDHAGGAGCVLAGVLVVLVCELKVEPPAGVGDHRHPAAQLDVVLRVRGVEHRDADARVAQHVAVLHAARHGREQHVTAIAADPHRAGLRAAIAIDRGQDRVVSPVKQPERRLTERDSHGGTVATAGNALRCASKKATIRRRASCAEASWYPWPGESRAKTANSGGILSPAPSWSLMNPCPAPPYSFTSCLIPAVASACSRRTAAPRSSRSRPP